MSDEFKTEGRLGLSFSFRRGRLLVYYSTIRNLGMPEYVRFLLNSKEKRIAIQKCEEIDRDGIRVPKRGEIEKYQFEINSSPLLSVIYKKCNWDYEKSYLVSGEAFPKNNLIDFDLNTAVIIAQDQFVDPERDDLKLPIEGMHIE